MRHFLTEFEKTKKDLHCVFCPLYAYIYALTGSCIHIHKYRLYLYIYLVVRIYVLNTDIHRYQGR